MPNPPVLPYSPFPLSPPPPPPPPPLNETIGLVTFLLVGALLAFGWGARAVSECEAKLRPEVSVSWTKPKDVTLKNGPSTFRYDIKAEKLIYKGAIGEAEKRTLKELYQGPIPQNAAQSATAEGTASAAGSTSGESGRVTSSSGSSGVAEVPPGVTGSQSGTASPPPGGSTTVSSTTSPTPGGSAATSATRTTNQTQNQSQSRALTPGVNVSGAAAREVYEAAIDELAFSSAEQGTIPMRLILTLGALGGIFGALLRSLNDFVGTVCYTGEFDLKKYWPMHLTRPFVGAILGCFTIILFNAGFLTSTGTQSTTSAWWSIAVAFLAGFSTLDVTERLRSTAKALFGSATSDRSRSDGSDGQAANRTSSGATAGGNANGTPPAPGGQ